MYSYVLLHYMYLKAQSTFMNPLQCVLKLTLDTGELNFMPVQCREKLRMVWMKYFLFEGDSLTSHVVCVIWHDIKGEMTSYVIYNDPYPSRR